MDVLAAVPWGTASPTVGLLVLLVLLGRLIMGGDWMPASTVDRLIDSERAINKDLRESNRALRDALSESQRQVSTLLESTETSNAVLRTIGQRAGETP